MHLTLIAALPQDAISPVPRGKALPPLEGLFQQLCHFALGARTGLRRALAIVDGQLGAAGDIRAACGASAWRIATHMLQVARRLHAVCIDVLTLKHPAIKGAFVLSRQAAWL